MLFSKMNGVHVPHMKNTCDMPAVRIPVPDNVVIPMNVHIGAPAVITVKEGDTVEVGQLIAETGGFVSSPVHASVSGVVTKIDKITATNGSLVDAVFIKSDGKNVVKLSINSESVDITSSNQNSSSFENIKVISFEGEPINISCSGNYLQDAIKALDSENITISFSGELKPMILTNNEDTSIVQLIAPIRTYR